MSIGINLGDDEEDDGAMVPSSWKEDFNEDFKDADLEEDLQTWPGNQIDEDDPLEEKLILFWGYKHTSGTYQAKRYFGPLDTDEARDSPFCEKVVGPFPARDREEALEKVKQLII